VLNVPSKGFLLNFNVVIYFCFYHIAFSKAIPLPILINFLSIESVRVFLKRQNFRKKEILLTKFLITI